MSYLYAWCLEHKLILKTLSINHGYLALWITINPSDLRCSLVFEFANVSFFGATNQTAFQKMQDHTATINSVAIA